jgi:hypothetical protein
VTRKASALPQFTLIFLVTRHSPLVTLICHPLLDTLSERHLE